MKLSDLKRALAASFVLAGLAVAGAILAVLTAVIISFGAGANPATAFTPADEPLSERAKAVSWNADRPNLLRSVERQTREDIARTWVGAISGEANEVWFSDGALNRRQQAQELIDSNASTEAQVVWESHQVATHFYSIDGQVMGLEVTSTGALENPGDPNSLSLSISERYEVVMILRDGNWRVERFRRL